MRLYAGRVKGMLLKDLLRGSLRSNIVPPGLNRVLKTDKLLSLLAIFPTLPMVPRFELYAIARFFYTRAGAVCVLPVGDNRPLGLTARPRPASHSPHVPVKRVYFGRSTLNASPWIM